MVAAAEPYVGKYFSLDYVRRKVLRQTDVDILEQDELIKKEIENGLIPDPNAPIDPATGMPVQPGAEVGAGGQAGMDLGEPVMEPSLDSQGAATELTGVEPPAAPKIPKGGEI